MAAMTSLAAQLERLATPQTSILDLARDKRSILFSPAEAAKYGRDVYFDIGRSGFDVLAKIDLRFAPYSNTLFGRASRDLQRAVEGQEVNMRLDKELEAFLLLLSPYLQKEAALKALEWLVYRYQVNDMNKRALLMCVFPYYESALFTRVLQVVALSGDQGEWQWLSQCQKSARPPPKLSIFTQWAKKQVFRNFVADYLKKMLKVHSSKNLPSIASSFFITTVLGGLGTVEVTDDHLASIVKSLPQCLASLHPHLVSGTYLIVAHLACNTHLAPNTLSAIVSFLLKTPPPTPELFQPCLLTLLALSHHQDLTGVPGEILAPLGEREGLLDYLQDLAREKSVAALVCPYILGCLSSLMEEDKKMKKKEGKEIKNEKEEEEEEEEDEEERKKKNKKKEEEEKKKEKEKEKRNKERKFHRLIKTLEDLVMSSSDAAKVIWSVLEGLSRHPGLLCIDVAQSLRSLERCHPEGHTQAIARLSALQNDAKCGHKYRKVLQALLLPSASNEPYCFTQLVHTNEVVRSAAAKGYLERLARGVGGTEEVTALHVKSMLCDECPAITELALGTPEALKTLTPSILARQCQNLIEKQGKGWKKVRKLSVAALCGTVVENGDARTRDMALSTCLPLVLVPTVPSDVALAKIILKSKIVRHSPFLGALVGCVGAEVPAETYSDRVWSAMPLVIAKLSATEKLALWGLLECKEEECQGGGRLVVALCLLHAALGTRGVKGEVAVSLGHRMVDGCLALLEDATNRTPPPAPRDWSGHRVSPQDIHTYIRQATRGDPPYDLLVTCVLRAASLFDLPPACTKSPFWTPMMEDEPGQGHLLLLVKVTRAALRLERSGVTSARDAILLKVFKECLGDPRAQLHFLALVWGWQAALPYSTLIDDTMQIWCLKLGVALLSRGTPLSWTLAPDSPLVPSLLSALTSHEGGVRRGAVECLGCLSAIPGGALTVESLVAVVKVVVDRAEEVIEDGSQLASVVRSTEGSQGRQQQQATQSLLGLVVAGLAPQHIKAALLYTLSGATQPTILLNLIPLAKDLLAKTEKKKFASKSKKKEEEEEEEEEEEKRLDPSSSLCLLYILQRFTTEAAGVLETEAGWGVFRKALSSAHPCLSIHGEMVSPQSVLLEEVLTSKFLRSLSSEMTQARLWSLLVGRVTSSADPNEASRLRHALRRVTLDAEVIGGQIEALQLAPKVTSLKEARERRLKLKEDTAHQEAWQKLHLMMETLTVMADLRRPWLLVGPLFNVLHLTLTLDLSSTALIQQQVLSTLIHLLHKAIDELGEKEVGCVCVVSVEVVVKVVRASLSHDTQRRALLLLALAARIVPESVLHNMMSIFTFMGTSLLRRDDSYSFQVIHQTIQAIVPTLIKSQGAGVEVRLAQVCQVFVDALPDLPHHRRLPLFTQLADTLHPDANLWLLLALLADSHVMRSGGGGGGGGGGSGGDEGEDKHSLPQVIQFSLSVAFHFPASVQLRACIKLVALVSALPDDLDGAKIQQNQQQKRRRSIEPKKKRRKRKIEEEEEEEEEEMEEEEEEVDVCLLPLSTHTQRQIFYFKYTTMAMLGHLLANEIFVAKVYEVEQQHHHQEGGGGDGGGGGSGGGGDGGGGVLQGLFQHLLQLSMCLLQSVTSACHLHQDKPQGRLYTSLQRKVMEVVEGVTALLPPPALLRVTQGLLTSPVALVRLKGAELLAAKLMPSAGVFFRAADTPALQVCVGTLTTATANKEEGAENRQTYLFCLQLVIRYLASHTQPPTDPHTLQPTLDAAVGVVCGQGEDVRVVTQALLVVAEAVATLQVAAVGCLSRLMPTLLKLLSTTTTTTTTTATIATTTATTAATTTSAAAATTTQLLATLTALHKVVNSLPQLLSPYLEELVCQVCLVKPPREATGVREGKVAGKLAGLREALVKNLEARVLVPQMSKAFQRLSRGESLWPLRTLVGLVEGVVEEVPGPTLPNHRPALLSLLTAALDIRHAKSTTLKKKKKEEEEEEEEELSAVEGTAFTALSRLLLRLPEQDNIAIFSSLVTWATPQDPRRLLVFYRFSAHLATTYKVLFLAAHLADLLLTPAADLLTAINDNPHVFGKDAHTETLTCALLTAILETLTKICAHDSIGFITHERFHLLCAPLAALVGNEVGGSEAYRQRVSWHLSPCLARLALAGGDDTLWRKLTNLVLAYLKEESTRPQVTLGALEVFGGLVEALGEDYLRPLVADVIPSITEALESVNTDVESATRCLFSKMEGILGDTLRAYLDH